MNCTQNGDTMGAIPAEFFDVSVTLEHPIALEPEGGGNAVLGSDNWDTMGWGYWQYPTIPSVDSWKWLDSRRLTNICERWSKDHTNALQYALFNGDGFESCASSSTCSAVSCCMLLRPPNMFLLLFRGECVGDV